MELITYDFQQKAEDALYDHIVERLDSAEKSTEDNQILFLSMVASGKTKMTSSVANRILKEYDDVAFFFFSPSSAQLHENAYEEIKAYGWENMEVLNLQEMVLRASSNNGNVPPNTFTTIGWSDVNKKKNNIQMKIGETDTFASIMPNNKTKIVNIYDEGHSNQDQQRLMKELVRPYAEAIVTATSKKDQLKKAEENLRVIQVDPQDVIAEGKVVGEIIVNDAGMDKVDPDGSVKEGDAYGWEEEIAAGLHRRDWLDDRWKKIVGTDVTHLCCIQLPNDDKNEKKDAPSTVKNYERAKQIVMDLGVPEEDIIIWVSGRRDVDPYTIQDTKHKVLIFKLACSVGWNCPRAKVFPKLREPSQSDTLDEQTMGRFLRTTDVHEWLTNAAYQNDEYLNAAYVYTASEEYDASLKGYAIKSERLETKMRDEYIDEWEKLRLVKIVPGHKYLADEDDIITDLVEKFNENFPCEYKENGGAWVVKGDVKRRVAREERSVADMMNDIGESGKSITSGHMYVDMSNEKVEDYVWARIKKESSLRQHLPIIEAAITNHLNENLCYNIGSTSGGSFLDAPSVSDVDLKMEKRDDFFKGIHEHFDSFAQACLDAISGHYKYYDDIVFDGDDNSKNKMYVPKLKPYVGVNPVDTPAKSNYIYEEQPGGKPSKPEQHMIAEFMSKQMDSWFKNGTMDRDDFLIAYKDDNDAHCKFFPDFISIKDRVLYLIETKGDVDAKGDHAIEPEKDKAKAKAIHAWMNKYKTKSIQASDCIDDIVFGIAKRINGDWKIYQGDGDDYDTFTSENWKLLSDIIK